MLDFQCLEQVELFPSPLLKHFWDNSEELNRALTELILAKEKGDVGIATTNVGGWHSKKDFQRWDGKCVRVLLARIQSLCSVMINRCTFVSEPETLNDWTIQAWANINRYGDYNKFHHHIRNSNLLSGVYYVSAGVEQGQDVRTSRIIFSDRYEVAPKGREDSRRKYMIQPEPGLMLLFPSSLGHRVEPHRGPGERITIAFNMKSQNFTTINYEIEKNQALVQSQGDRSEVVAQTDSHVSL
jgi:uncharacterized protein (TIGR02466 family)